MSAQKQCPKCGEKNPAEAVMCWACYTSLSGGVAAPGGTLAAPGAATVMGDSGDKKKADPKQLAIIGVGLLVALGFGAKMMLGGGEEKEEILPTFTSTKTGTGTPPPTPTTSEPINTGTTVQTGGTAPAQPAGPVVQAPPFPYTLAAAPNARLPYATMAIVPNQGELKESEAQALAKFADRYQQKAKKFPTVEIFVINNPQQARRFAEYQSSRRGEQMTDRDYQALQDVWGSTPVRYVNKNGKASFSSPQRSPGNFWNTSSEG